VEGEGYYPDSPLQLSDGPEFIKKKKQKPKRALFNCRYGDGPRR
jgi:hypothetical protein